MPAFVIAEAGVNHNGDLDIARALVDTAAQAGADAIKFQTFRADAVASPAAQKAVYQTETTDAADSHVDVLKKLELPHDWHHDLKKRAQDQGLIFMSTAFDRDSLDFLVKDVEIDRIKVPSGELTNGPLLLAVARTGLPSIVSTGMANMDEIARALGVLAFGYLGLEVPGVPAFDEAYAAADGKRILADKVCLLHCTTEYPAPFADIDLNAMGTLASAFGLPVGLSDHSAGITVPIAAVALGAEVIEKHFTMDATLVGPDHKASLEPAELVKMVTSIRETEAALGAGLKEPKPSERANMSVARRSLIALKPIAAGAVYTESNLGALRPGAGISPMRYWEFLGTRAPRALDAGEAIDE
jgi:N-acetylneuraminate synthase